jgi:hypothetical protein
MLFSRFLIKHYTPPTCTLEIYGPTFPFSRSKSKHIPAELEFNLHFDDPRLPEEERVTIKGDRSQLELLSQVINNYLHLFLQSSASSFPFPSSQPEDNAEQSSIYLVNQGLLNQELHYPLAAENNLKTVIKLTASQLFDLANALEDYTIDINQPQTEKISLHETSSIVSTVAIMVMCVGLGAIWWRERLFVSQDNQNPSIPTLELDKNLPKIDNVIPPEPLNPSTIPPVPFPQLPSNLQNLTKLPPPPPINQPLKVQSNDNSNNQLTPPARGDSNIAPTPTLLPPPPAPAPAIVVPSPPTSTPPNIIAIKPNSDANLSSTATPPPAANPGSGGSLRFPKLPTLEGNSSLPRPTTIDPGLSNSLRVVAPKIGNPPPLLSVTPTEKPTTKSQNIATQTEVKQYFQQRWQPPENLTQSIEYRLVINNDGTIERVTPMGQVSRTFLDRTGMPLMGEVIVSSRPDHEQATIRLILSPNGNVETFLE